MYRGGKPLASRKLSSAGFLMSSRGQWCEARRAALRRARGGLWTGCPVAYHRGFACLGVQNRLRVSSAGLRGRSSLGAAHQRVGRPLRLLSHRFESVVGAEALGRAGESARAKTQIHSVSRVLIMPIRRLHC